MEPANDESDALKRHQKSPPGSRRDSASVLNAGLSKAQALYDWDQLSTSIYLG